MSMAFFVLLFLGTVLCALVAGLLFSFAVIIMPGLRNLGDREFIGAFQQIDGVIQRGQPLFGLVWLGSALALLAGVALGLGQLEGIDRALILVGSGLYLLGVQLPTFVVNIPLNNALQNVDVDSGNEVSWRSAREAFESRWNRWNVFRTCIAVLVTVMLVLLVSRACEVSPA
jgi:uncharacterized membrane protein